MVIKNTKLGTLVTVDAKTDPSDVALLMARAQKAWKGEHFSVFAVDNFIMYSGEVKKADAKKLFPEVYKAATKQDFDVKAKKESWFQVAY